MPVVNYELASWPSITRMVGLTISTFLVYRIALVIYRIYFHPLSRFPGPKIWAASGLPVGWVDKIQGKFTKKMTEVHAKYGPIVRIGPNRLAVDGAIIWSEVFTRRPNLAEFTKVPETYPGQEKYVGILSTQERADHRRQRKLLAHAFSDIALQEQEGYIQYYVDLLIQRLGERTAAGEIVDMTQWFNFTTFDIIGELAFADSFQALEKGRYHPWIAMIFSTIRQASAVQLMALYPLLFPLVALQIGPKELARIYRQSKSFIELGKEKTRKRQAMTEPRKDIMAYVLRHNTTDGKGMSQDEIYENARVLIGAGSETTATALAGLVFYTCQTPEVYKRLASEIRAAFTCEENITMRSSALPYLQACLDEILRIYPPAAETPPRVSPGDYIHYNGEAVWMPKGVRLSNYMWATHHSAAHFTDPLQFVPERWLPSSHPLYNPRYANDNKAACRPFAAGPRDCIGKNLAYSEMRYIVARLFWNFDLALVEGQDDWVDSQLVFGLYQKGPLMAALHPRDN